MSRNTLQQQIISDTVKSMTNHPSPDEVFKKVHDSYPTIGRATVYRVLNKLADKGEILRIKVPGSADRYDFRTDDHIHLHCRVCDSVTDAEFPEAYELLNQLRKVLSKDHSSQIDGFKTEGAVLSFHGICSKCQNQ